MSSFPDLVKRTLSLLGFPDITLSLKENSNDVSLTLTAPEDASGVLIGFHGEKIDALQLLFSLFYNQDKTTYLPLRLDINGYRVKREQSVLELAENAASQALQSGREIILPPLSAGERRIIHLKLGDRQDVTTYSEGDGRNRRLIIRPIKS